jgi:hypothetical protein
MEPDPAGRRFKETVSRLNRRINSLKAMQVQTPHVADSLQELIDKTIIQRDAYSHHWRECVCGVVRGDHIGDERKCPFASTTFLDKHDPGDL